MNDPDEQEFLRYIESQQRAFFHYLDEDASGRLNQSENTKGLDLNRDHMISLEEFQKAGLKQHGFYCPTSPPSPHNQRSGLEGLKKLTLRQFQGIENYFVEEESL